ncbi:TetR/AcrR family transcriptional regulator C-terminal domain-containing protein [Nannocystis sp. RBIL2]|uniref:TetR/AcrR family transcriptional regulator C-terminal domain-containing protein n=1 Tax=Nannocystis sp. RBIL2 TaxID=2996788 RepID=UPI0023EE586C|nr:TetR/AcrR family transcriptional regulator C-terminal domain-containing protein [Nannocystis sp. RBIL2]
MVLADSGGIESLSMRKLAGELGIEAMSLYHHVKSKEDILDGMVDIVFGEMELPSPGEAWKTAMRRRAESTRAVLARHPWAIAILDSRTTPGPATLRYSDTVIGYLRAAGFSIPMAAHALSILDSYVRGFAMQEASLPLDPSGSIQAATESILEQQPMMSNAFPHLGAMAAELILKPGYAYGNEFQFGLGLILDGLERALATENGPQRGDAPAEGGAGSQSAAS